LAALVELVLPACESADEVIEEEGDADRFYLHQQAEEAAWLQKYFSKSGPQDSLFKSLGPMVKSAMLRCYFLAKIKAGQQGSSATPTLEEGAAGAGVNTASHTAIALATEGRDKELAERKEMAAKEVLARKEASEEVSNLKFLIRVSRPVHVQKYKDLN